jgi:tRNA (guanine37-N1)-methyltransferase
MDNLYVALIHFPVMNRKGDPIGSALTTIDLHDIARASRTFGVRGFYVVTPFEDQARLAHQVLDHWICGKGGVLNPSRKAALVRVRVVPDVETAVRQIKEERNQPVRIAATSAKKLEGAVSPAIFKQMLADSASHVLAFGTAWGLSDEFIKGCDIKLEPITGPGDYNHLSVRSAASIYLDRITNG